MNENGNLRTKLPVFDDKNLNGLSIQMCMLFGTQNVLDLVNDNFVQVALPANATDAMCAMRKKDQKALFYIH